MKPGQLVEVSSGRIGVVVETKELLPDNRRPIFFGDVIDDEPLIEVLVISGDWKVIETPKGV